MYAGQRVDHDDAAPKNNCGIADTLLASLFGEGRSYLTQSSLVIELTLSPMQYGRFV